MNKIYDDPTDVPSSYKYAYSDIRNHTDIYRKIYFWTKHQEKEDVPESEDHMLRERAIELLKLGKFHLAKKDIERAVHLNNEAEN